MGLPQRDAPRRKPPRLLASLEAAGKHHDALGIISLGISRAGHPHRLFEGPAFSAGLEIVRQWALRSHRKVSSTFLVDSASSKFAGGFTVRPRLAADEIPVPYAGN